MKFDAAKLGLSTGIIFGIVWIICSVFVVIVPTGMMQLSGMMIHGNMGNLGWTMNWAGFLFGLVMWSLLAGGLAGAIAALYNRLID